MITPRTNEISVNYALEEAINDIEDLAPDVGLYIRYLYESLEPYADDPKFGTKPELVDKCFGPNGLDDDISDITHHLTQDIAPLARAKCLEDLLRATLANPVQHYYTRQLAEYFDVRLPNEPPSPEENRPIRFYAPNLHISPAETENFCRACGLKAITDEGIGSHIKWIDPATDLTIAVTSQSSVIWLKNKIKAMLQSGLPVERIEEACRKLKIDFRVLSR